MTTIAKVRGIEKLSPAQLHALVETAKKLDIHPDWLATVISFETAGTFSPSILNAAGSGAFGLIQFMPNTAKVLLGTTTATEAVAQGRAMSFNEQLEKMVIPYFRGRVMRNLNDVYLAVFYPAAMGKPDSYVVGSVPSAVYNQNAVFDKEGKGYITRADITRTINSVLDAANGVRLTIGSNLGQIVAGLAVSGGLYYLYKHYLKTGIVSNILQRQLSNTGIRRIY